MRRVLASAVIATLAFATVSMAGPALAQSPEKLGFLVVEPARGDLLTPMDLATSGVCTRGTMFAVTIAGPNLDNPDRGNLIGVTKIQTLAPESYPGHYVVPLPTDLATYIATTAPGQRIKGDYTITFACRDTLSTDDLQVFTADLRVDGKGRYTVQGDSAMRIDELIDGYVPGSSGVIMGDPLLPDAAEIAEAAAQTPPAEPSAWWRPALIALGVLLLAGAGYAWWRGRRTPAEAEPERESAGVGG